MKKSIALLVALLFCISASSFAFAEESPYDLSTLSDEELYEGIKMLRDELTRRENEAPVKTVVYDQDGVLLYLTGIHEIKNDELVLFAVLENNRDEDIMIMLENLSVNGWENIYSWAPLASAGKKVKDNITISLEKTDITEYRELKEMEFNLYVFNTVTYDEVFVSDTITLHFNMQE